MTTSQSLVDEILIRGHESSILTVSPTEQIIRVSLDVYKENYKQSYEPLGKIYTDLELRTKRDRFTNLRNVLRMRGYV